ncbi:HPr family phosphocarrier protein [Enterocloster sp.]|uniref:HPr family phosphocarrier protein n=1 Tax=Enterocloster sp. TaxID=2719315 RepID=UPI00308024F4
MKKKIITVELPDGLEARPAAMLVQVASQYDSRIYLESGSKRVNAKSIMGMMTLGLIAGQSITVEVDGADEDQAVSEIEKYLINA